MLVEVIGCFINKINFKNCIMHMDSSGFVFINKNNDDILFIGSVEEKRLINKFKLTRVDMATNDLLHIKFLIKYITTVSNLISEDEFKNIEFDKIVKKI